MRSTTPTSSARASTAAIATVVGCSTASTPIAMSSPATTPTRRATDRLNALNGSSRRLTSGTSAAKSGGCVAPSSSAASHATAAATTMRATCGSSARRIARHDPVALLTRRSCRVSGMPSTGHAPANGLQMYYEIHGEEHGGVPVLLLHGAYMTTADFGPLLPGLAATRQVVVCDLHGHGRTGHADRPLTYEGMADDAAALLAHLVIAEADVVGFSMGGGVAIQLAV